MTYPTVTSNIFDPMELDTAISPRPCLATTTLVIKSGMLVPAAIIVSPMICEQKKNLKKIDFTTVEKKTNR